MAIELREITADNWLEAIRLKVAPDQMRFVASNAFSLAQSKYEPFWIPMGIYHEGTMIGFIMYGLVEEGGPYDGYWILRLMVGEKYQNQGYGKAAMVKVMELIWESGYEGSIFLDFEIGNDRAERLYTGLGFQDTGEVEDGERIFCLYGKQCSGKPGSGQ